MKLIKMLGLAAMVAMAVSAVAATAASASYRAEIPSEEELPGKFHGKQTKEYNHVFKVEGNAVECKVASFEGPIEAASQNTVRVGATYKECKAFGFNATVTMNGCEYEFNEPTETSENQFEATANLVCPVVGNVRQEVVIVGGTCEAKVPGYQTATDMLTSSAQKCCTTTKKLHTPGRSKSWRNSAGSESIRPKTASSARSTARAGRNPAPTQARL